MARKHPFETLKQVREDAVEGATRELSSAMAARERAAAAERAQRAAREALEAKLEEERRVEERALASGELRAGDLSQGARYQVQAEGLRVSADEAVEQSRAATTKADRGVVEARGGVEAAKANLDVVEKTLAKDAAQKAAKEAAALEEEVDARSGARFARRG